MNEILTDFENTMLKLQQVLADFNQEKLNSIPFEGSWTAAQVTVHVIKSESLIAGLLYGKTNPTERNPHEKIQMVKEIFLDFTTKMTSPALILPPDEAQEKAVLISNLKAVSGKVSAAIQTLNLSETCAEFVLPNIGEMTRAEWIYFIIYHTQRHIHQLENISKTWVSETLSHTVFLH